jgi:probable rRNA maturation factor
MKDIRFFSEDCTFVLKNKALVRQWIQDVLKHEGYRPGALNFIFCSDAYLLQINQEYLKHDTFTDIVTFPYEDQGKRISGDMFISIDRIQENAEKFQVAMVDELHRVMIHGVLHLCGYKDKTKADQALMRQKENESLAKRWLQQ